MQHLTRLFGSQKKESDVQKSRPSRSGRIAIVPLGRWRHLRGAYLRVPACSGCGVASARPDARSGDSTWRARGFGGFPLGRGPDPPPGGHPTRGRGGHLLAPVSPRTPVAEVSRGGSPMGGACYGARVRSQKRTPGGLVESNRPVPARCQAARSLWAMAARGS
ncbi:hypothetical protein MTO96_049866 [Rhipicephalus appendiculatus]